MSREFYNEFNEWFHEIENYSFRSERFHNDVDMIPWLVAAFESGASGPQRQLDLLACGATVLTPSSVEHAQLMIRAAQRYIDYNKGKHDEQPDTTSTDDSNGEQQPA
jgi:hypothetical protein